MESGASEGRGFWQTIKHRKPIIVAVTVSFLNIPHFLNGISFSAAAHDITGALWKWDEQRRMTQISYIVGGILAYALFAFLFQRYRRKTCLYLVCVCHLTTSILLLCTNSYWLLHVSRASSAIGDIGAGMFCVIYVSEIAPDEIRGSLVGIHKMLFNLTELIPTVMYLLHVPLKSLPFSCISIVISVFVVICTYVAVPESPIYFLRREDNAGAKESLEFLYGNEANVSQLIANRKKILKATRSDLQTTTSIFEECLNRRTLTFTCIAIALYFLRIVVGFWSARFHVDGVLWKLPKASYNNESHFLIIDVCLMLLANLLVLVLCDRVGRKILIMVSLFTSSIALIGEGIIFYVHLLDYNNWKTIRIIFIVFSLLYLISLNLGISILPEVLITDIFAPKVLNTQIAILGSFHLCVDYVIHYEIYNPMEPPLSGYGIFLLFGGLSCIGTLLFFKFLLETKGRAPGFMFMDTEESVLYSTLDDEE
ncbi:hypothetical protein R5R35_005729 [Gryllus longicercus]|uniref:Major facilitator superfamily (MFS) profile domain-containing protein n=1 Tax=Gryllus longicercus TaxID=2509291 RepID=A0AAN9W3U1_9ORTH